MAEERSINAAPTGVTIGVVKESVPGETRVGLIPDSVKHLIGKGTNVIVQTGAGEGSSISDREFQAAGARVVGSLADVHASADVVVRVQSPAPDRGELEGLKRDQIVVSFLAPLVNHDMNRQLAATGVTAMAVDAVPRITRAQSMDALSAMSTIAGYKAVLLAAEKLPKFFPLLMTAAGTIRPASVLVLGAGVAGLQAIATARRLGAVVSAYDARPVVKEQVESLGAKFVVIDTGASDAETAGGYAREATAEELRKQQEGLNEHIAKADVVITTALVPGRPAPLLIPAVAVERMHHGSVIVDLAAETGGNCELTTPGEVTIEHGVTIIGTLNLPATLPVHASQMYAKVITNFLDLLVKDGQINLNFDDEIIANMAITNRGDIVQAQTRKMMGLDDQPAAPEEAAAVDTSPESAAEELSEAETALSGGLDEDSADVQEDSERYPVLADAEMADEPGVVVESSDAGHAVAEDSVTTVHGFLSDADAADVDAVAFEGDVYPTPSQPTTEVESADVDMYPEASAATLSSESWSSDSRPDSVGDAAVTEDGSNQGDILTESLAAGFAEVEDEGLAFEAFEHEDDGAKISAAESETGDGPAHAEHEASSETAESHISTNFDSADAWSQERDDGVVVDHLPDTVELEDVYSTAEFVGEPVDSADGDEATTATGTQHDDAEAFPGESDFVAAASPSSSGVNSSDVEEDDDDDEVVYGSHEPALGTSAKSSKLPKYGEGTDWVAGDGTANVPDGYPIKGNANSGLYHPHESPSYENTIAEICFASATAAETHGYRLPKGLEKAAREAAQRAEEEKN